MLGMTLVRRIARPLLASIFVTGGIEALAHPAPKTDASEQVQPVAVRIPGLPEDPEQLVRVNAAAMIAAGSLLALGRLPRLSALVLAGTLVPTTLTAHRFWEAGDKEEKARQRSDFFKNLGLLGGLLIAAVDTEAKPGIAWRTRRAAHDAGREARIAKLKARQLVA